MRLGPCQRPSPQRMWFQSPERGKTHRGRSRCHSPPQRASRLSFINGRRLGRGRGRRHEPYRLRLDGACRPVLQPAPCTPEPVFDAPGL